MTHSRQLLGVLAIALSLSLVFFSTKVLAATYGSGNYNSCEYNTCTDSGGSTGSNNGSGSGSAGSSNSNSDGTSANSASGEGSVESATEGSDQADTSNASVEQAALDGIADSYKQAGSTIKGMPLWLKILSSLAIMLLIFWLAVWFKNRRKKDEAQ